MVKIMARVVARVRAREIAKGWYHHDGIQDCDMENQSLMMADEGGPFTKVASIIVGSSELCVCVYA